MRDFSLAVGGEVGSSLCHSVKAAVSYFVSSTDGGLFLFSCGGLKHVYTASTVTLPMLTYF